MNRITRLGKAFKTGAVSVADDTWTYIPAVVSGVSTGIKKKSISAGIERFAQVISAHLIIVATLTAIESEFLGGKKEE